MSSITIKQNRSMSAFTLIEMVIVLIIIGIILMSTLYFSGEQIQKVRDKTVKESILAEWQSRYSRNLWSSSYGWIMYKYLDISLSGGDNKISFDYTPKNTADSWKNSIFTDKFIIQDIIVDPDSSMPINEDSVTFRYIPYQIPCERWKKDNDWNLDTGGMHDKLLFIARVNDSRDYCFEIQKKNCRLMEVSSEKCWIEESLIN